MKDDYVRNLEALHKEHTRFFFVMGFICGCFAASMFWLLLSVAEAAK